MNVHKMMGPERLEAAINHAVRIYAIVDLQGDSWYFGVTKREAREMLEVMKWNDTAIPAQLDGIELFIG